MMALILLQMVRCIYRFFFFFFLIIRPPPKSTLFPYTMLFRSRQVVDAAFVAVGAVELLGELQVVAVVDHGPHHRVSRSEEHTSELQSRENLVCRLLLEKKKKNVVTIFLKMKAYLMTFIIRIDL